MLFIAPSTDGGRRRQKGQAIVLIALIITALIGFLGLAIDGGRAYIARRELQDAVDASALAAGDNLLRTNTEANAENDAASWFAANMRLGGAMTQSAWGTDNASASWTDFPGTFAIKVTHNAFNGTNFQVQAAEPLNLAFMQVLGTGPQITVRATATSVVMSQSQTPALLTLSQSGCAGTTGNSLVINGNANVALVGALYSNGSVFSQAAGASITVAGNAFGQCGSIPGTVQLVCYNPNTNPPSSAGPPTSGVCPAGTTLGQDYPNSPAIPDPGYNGPSLTGLTNMSVPSTTVELQPGNYAGSVLLPASSSCYFLDPGVYEWTGGFTMNGGLLSNELRPPDEPVPGNNTTRQNPNFWYGTGTNILHCDGGFSVAPVICSGCPAHFPSGTYGVIVTTVRSNDNGFYRESAPSMCRTFSADGTKGFQVAISNVPGAQAYNVYASASGCSGPYGWVGSFSNTITETNSATGGCPYTPPWPAANASATPGSGVNAACSLGYTISPTYDKSNVANLNIGSYCSLSGPNAQGCLYPTSAPSSPGSDDGGEQPPAASGLPNLSPLRDVFSNAGGDRADENECRTQSASASAAAPCQGATVTPGAVQFYFPGPSACFAVQGSTGSTFGDLYIFGGLQYRGIVMYAPSSNTCSSDKLAGGSSTTVIGTVYMPGSSLSVKGGAQTAISGQVIVSTASIDGTSGTAITYNPALSPPAPGARLIV